MLSLRRDFPPRASPANPGSAPQSAPDKHGRVRHTHMIRCRHSSSIAVTWERPLQAGRRAAALLRPPASCQFASLDPGDSHMGPGDNACATPLTTDAERQRGSCGAHHVHLISKTPGRSAGSGSKFLSLDENHNGILIHRRMWHTLLVSASDYVTDLRPDTPTSKMLPIMQAFHSGRIRRSSASGQLVAGTFLQRRLAT